MRQMCCPDVQTTQPSSPTIPILAVLAGVTAAILLHAVAYLIIALALLALCIFGALGLMIYLDHRPKPSVRYQPRSLPDPTPDLRFPLGMPRQGPVYQIQQLNVYNNQALPGAPRVIVEGRATAPQGDGQQELLQTLVDRD